MPFYDFENINTGERYQEYMKISELDDYKLANPHIKQIVAAPLISSGRGMKKPDDGFRDVLKEIKKNNSRGFTRSTINTF